MAEALLRCAAGRRFEVESSGVAPTEVHPLAIAAMAEIGIDIGGQRAKDVSEIEGHPDILITLCEEAKEACPFFPGAPRFLHWNLPDPAAARSDEAAAMAVFRRVRDSLALLVRKFIEGVEE
jgi:arsenate reductase